MGAWKPPAHPQLLVPGQDSDMQSDCISLSPPKPKQKNVHTLLKSQRVQSNKEVFGSSCEY